MSAQDNGTAERKWATRIRHSQALFVLLVGAGFILAAPGVARAVDVPFTERVISITAEQARSVFATDIDGDGDTDVLSASSLDDKIAWYESDGGSPPTFTERVISTTADRAFSVFATDLDGDGDTDVLSASAFDDKIAWYESDGGSPPSFTERVISSAADGAISVFATDLDGDGHTDVLSASVLDDTIAWYENLTDCNDNGIPDEVDIAEGTSEDCNGNGVPDECEDDDCNDNGIPDECDIAEGTSQDRNDNGVPDECESTWYVDDDSCPEPGTGSEADPFCSIQRGIDESVNGDEVIVAPGTYNETINFSTARRSSCEALRELMSPSSTPQEWAARSFVASPASHRRQYFEALPSPRVSEFKPAAECISSKATPPF